MELSTQLVIQEALNRDAAVEVLDASENIIRIHKRNTTEIIKQATRTSADSYISALLMENKTVTKKLLSEAGLHTPSGYEIGSIDELRPLNRKGSPESGLAVKPKSTNFGIGVTLLNPGYTEEELRIAASNALKFDSMALVEDKIEGKEFRFLVIEGKVRAVLERVPANITGDGISTIKQLVRIKNRDPRRGSGYRFPMEKIRLGPVEKYQLYLSGLTPESVPADGQLIFLRKNSNISTGGEGIDRTDEVHPGYFEIAVQAAQTVGAAICGIDIIIDDMKKEPESNSYGIIELNFNPALHIHNYPFIGFNRRVETFVLDLLNIK